MRRFAVVFLCAAFTLALASALAAAEKKVHDRVPYTRFARVDEKAGGFTKHFKESRFEVARGGLFSVEALLIDGTLHEGVNNFDLVIHDSQDGDVAGAEVSAVARAKGGAQAAEARVEESDIHGLYGVRDLEISAPGDWELTVRVKKGAQADEAVFDFPGVK
ncbi:MAG: hypothetical protein Kow0025_08400 [Thermodesulfovibrionales bacterium]